MEIVQAGVEAIKGWVEEHFPLGMDLYGAFLHQAELDGAIFTGAMLSRANLDEASLGGADLSGADLTRSHLCGANLLGAELRMADLRGAKLDGADLTLADLSDTVLQGADFTGARFGYTLLGNVDLSGVNGLDTVVHAGPSSIGIDSLLRSKGQIPDAFLNGCGVPAALFANLRTLAEGSTQMANCYMNFDKAEAELADRICCDLQQRGLRCWKLGAASPGESKLLRQVEQRLRSYDRLVAVFSENAIENDEFVHEIERALRQEENAGRQVLYPVRCDSALVSWRDPLHSEVTRREVLDFSDWQRDAGMYRVTIKALAQKLLTGS